MTPMSLADSSLSSRPSGNFRNYLWWPQTPMGGHFETETRNIAHLIIPKSGTWGGAFESTDSGVSWVRIPAPAAVTAHSTSGDGAIGRLWFLPSEPPKLLVETGDGWYTIALTTTATAVKEEARRGRPESFKLMPAYPNPFNAEAILRYSLPATSAVELAVFSITGQKVATLFTGLREAGMHAVHWDGRDQAGTMLATGVYLLRLRAGAARLTEKLTILR